MHRFFRQHPQIAGLQEIRLGLAWAAQRDGMTAWRARLGRSDRDYRRRFVLQPAPGSAPKPGARLTPRQAPTSLIVQCFIDRHLLSRTALETGKNARGPTTPRPGRVTAESSRARISAGRC